MNAKELVARTKELEVELGNITFHFKEEHDEFRQLKDLGERAIDYGNRLAKELVAFQSKDPYGPYCNLHRLFRDAMSFSPLLWEYYGVECEFEDNWCNLKYEDRYGDLEYARIPLEWLDMPFGDVAILVRTKLADHLVAEERKKKEEEELREKKLLQALKEKYE